MLRRVFGDIDPASYKGPVEDLVERCKRVVFARNARYARVIFNEVTDGAGEVTAPEAVAFVRKILAAERPDLHISASGAVRSARKADTPEIEHARKRLAYQVLCAAFGISPPCKLLELSARLSAPAEGPTRVGDFLSERQGRADRRAVEALLGADSGDIVGLLGRLVPEVKPWHVFHVTEGGGWSMELRPLARAAPETCLDVTSAEHARAALPPQQAHKVYQRLP